MSKRYFCLFSLDGAVALQDWGPWRRLTLEGLTDSENRAGKWLIIEKRVIVSRSSE